MHNGFEFNQYHTGLFAFFSHGFRFCLYLIFTHGGIARLAVTYASVPVALSVPPNAATRPGPPPAVRSADV